LTGNRFRTPLFGLVGEGVAVVEKTVSDTLSPEKVSDTILPPQLPTGEKQRTDPFPARRKRNLPFASKQLAEWTGLEPATPGVTGRYSNQLNYHSDSSLVGAEGFEPPTFAL